MNRFRIRPRLAACALASLAFLLPATAAPPSGAKAFEVQYLVSDGSLPTPNEDASLINGWGIASGTTGPWLVAANAMNLAEQIDGNGVILGPVVSVPGSPTGVAANNGDAFVISAAGVSAPARFLIANENGTISGWNVDVPTPGASTQAIVVVDNGSTGAVYKGLTLATTSSGARLYATDFRNGRVDVFDSTFAPVTTPGNFKDPKLPDGYAPFGIQNVLGRIVVTYAVRSGSSAEEIAGQGLGIIDVFDTDGTLLARVASHGQLNAPWGLAAAPAGFGDLAGDLLVGNFGDGQIVVYSMSSDMRQFNPQGVLRDADHKPITIDGLWGLSFGNGAESGASTALYFASGPVGETHGAFGRILPPGMNP